MIFASDLDRTLVYSNRAIAQLGYSKSTVLIPVEKKAQEVTAYMTEKSLSFIQKLCQHQLFIPVTTRTTEQYNRILVFKEKLRLPYAITANGAEILYEGEPLREWSSYLTQILDVGALGMRELLSLLKQDDWNFIGDLRIVGTLFFYWILEKIPSMETITKLQKFVSSYGWRISLQGKKLYFIPKVISKGKALNFICSRERMNAIAGAGDSLLDLDFLQLCQYRFVPEHGELRGVSENWNLLITKKSGVDAGEEILQQFLTLVGLPI
ncbi:hypothetical protein HPT25_24510 [Bacillus sp. BRMEA1]|uniref:HAD family hydrolase n=1 Tax=Neobacillus endophyticus TaxID=2738405 RepID=UPI0015656EBB|nr:hypothetical protein [Neobacillus endophyticus]NRD80489.1 hypothetical protein [Neobacillus endophyticus]